MDLIQNYPMTTLWMVDWYFFSLYYSFYSTEYVMSEPLSIAMDAPCSCEGKEDISYLWQLLQIVNIYKNFQIRPHPLPRFLRWGGELL